MLSLADEEADLRRLLTACLQRELAALREQLRADVREELRELATDITAPRADEDSRRRSASPVPRTPRIFPVMGSRPERKSASRLHQDLAPAWAISVKPPLAGPQPRPPTSARPAGAHDAARAHSWTSAAGRAPLVPGCVAPGAEDNDGRPLPAPPRETSRSSSPGEGDDCSVSPSQRGSLPEASVTPFMKDWDTMADEASEDPSASPPSQAGKGPFSVLAKKRVTVSEQRRESEGSTMSDVVPSAGGVTTPMAPDSTFAHLKVRGRSEPKSVQPQTSHGRVGRRLKLMAEHPLFDGFSAMLIVSNAFMIGLQTNVEAHTSRDYLLNKGNGAFETGETVFCGLFAFELGFRMLAHRSKFVAVSGTFWAAFDSFIVTMQVVEEVLKAVNNKGSNKNISFLRLLRILRLTRIVRVVRLFRFAHELTMLVVSIINCMRSLFWTLVLLLLGIYTVGVYFTQIITDWRVLDGGDPDGDLVQFFGDLPSSMLTLYQVMSQGVNWQEVCRPLMTQVSAVQGWLFVLYTAFSVLALTNVVTGVFVQGALDSAKHEEERGMVDTLFKVFNEIDAEQQGKISAEQFQITLDHPSMQTYLESMNVDRNEAAALFALLDVDRSGTVDVEELTGGFMRLAGEVKAFDVMMVMNACRQILLEVESAHVSRASTATSGTLCKSVGTE